ncbi:MAG: translocation/assembly module TamB domain-containing protein [Marinobacter sp.]|uniref:translocation/assembly module TamB domain-containing protein n=1 Tax=Marinobacter sp. TaxID=50741 RepID=UPI0034A06B8B
MSRKRVIVRRLLIALAIVILVPVLLVAGILLALRSETGTAWVIEQVPGLEVDAGQGSLFGVWQADSLRWQGYGVRLVLVAPYIDWSPGCLWRKTLCLDTLRVSDIDVKTQPGEDSGESAGINLPAVILPINLEIGKVDLGSFNLNNGLIWDTLTLSAKAAGADLEIEELYVRRDTLNVTVSGRIDTRGDWPVALNVQTMLPPPEGENWDVGMVLSGSVRDLLVRGQSRGYLDARFDGGLAPLNPDLPARLNLRAEEFLALDSIPPTLTLKNWRLALEGSLANGFDIDTSALLPGARGEIDLALKGRVTTERATGLTLTLAAPYHREGAASELAVTGTVDWSGPLEATAELGLQYFPWYDLLPDLEPLPVSLNTLDAQATYIDGDYEATLSAGVGGPLGDTSLQADVKGDLKRVRINNLIVDTGAGGLKGDAKVAFAEQIAWDAQLELDQLNPGYWVPELEASLSGPVSTAGRLNEEGFPEATANVDISGSWQSNDTRIRGDLESANQQWNVRDLEVSVGENTVKGSGRWAESLAASVTLDLPRLGAFMPGLSGALKGNIEASGQPDSPVGTVQLEGTKLAWEELVTIDSLALNGQLQEGLKVNGEVEVRGLEASGQTVLELEVDVTGTVENHDVRFGATTDELAASLGFAGGWQDGWDGMLASARIELIQQNQTWTLADPATLVYQSSGELRMGQHCFEWQTSSLCASEQVLMPMPELNYKISRFPTAALAQLMPEGLRWDAEINGDVVLVMDEAGPDGRIHLDAGPGTVEVLARDEWQSLPYDELTTSLVLKPESAELALALAGPGLGGLTLEMVLDPSQESLPVEGQYNLSNLDVSLAGAFTEIEEIAGELNGKGRIAGPLLNPEVFGELILSRGRILDPTLPLPLEDIVLSMQLAGREAAIEGRWRSNERSEGTLDGSVGWSASPTVDLRITGDRLPFNYEPYARLEMNPDITLAYGEGALSVIGQVDIPRGTIEIRELPEQAVSVSEDEVIVGKEAEQPAPLSLNMDVTVNVGEDQVSFEGFGVTGNLAGSLTIGNNLDTRGALQLNDGHYEAYGQKLDLRRARLVFAGPVSEPYLDIEAVRIVDNVTAGLRLSGPVSEPQSEVFSEPPMPQGEALAYLVFGRPLRNSGEQGQVSQAALSMGLAQTSGFTRSLGEEVGIQNFVLETEGSGDSSAVVASGYLTQDLSIRYGVGVFEPVTKVALRYDLGRYFYVEAASGLAASLDLFYTRDF